MPLAGYPYTFTVPPAGNFAAGCIDWQNLIAHFITAGPFLNDFTVIPRINIANVNIAPMLPAGFAGFQCGLDGRIYFSTVDGNHPVYGYNPSGATVDKIWNATGLGLPSMNYLAAFEAIDQYVIVAAQTSGVIGALVACADMTGTPTLSGTPFNVDEHDTSIAPGNARLCRGNNVGIVAAISGSPTSTIGYYAVSPSAHTKIGTLTAVALDGNAAFAKFMIPGFDFSDNNIIHCVGTATADYIIKINRITGALIWKTVIPLCMDLQECSIIAGRLELVYPGGSPFRYQHIRLSDGVITQSITETVIDNLNFQAMFSDKYSFLISNLDSSAGAAAHWGTFGVPSANANVQGGLIRRG